MTQSNCPSPEPNLFQFDFSENSVKHNINLLQQYDYDLSELLAAYQNTLVAFGSKFHTLTNIKHVFGKNKILDFFSGVHKNGIEYCLMVDLTCDKRMAKLKAQVLQVNNQSASWKLEELRKKIHREV